MWKDKSPGVKILWVWAIGTAAVLVANVATTRLRDLDRVMDNLDQTSQVTESASIDTSTNRNQDVAED